MQTFNIVLIEPEIPPNTGNIARLCAATAATLHLVGKLGFSIDDRYLKRAGLDYWDKVKLYFHDSLEDLIALYPDQKVYYCTTKAEKSYHKLNYQQGDIFIFGPESRGIPEDILGQNPEYCITIPLHDEIRSINLCNSVAIILYEGLRQIDFNF